MGKSGDEQSSSHVAKLSGAPNLEVRFVSCNESAIKKCSELISLTHEYFHDQTLDRKLNCQVSEIVPVFLMAVGYLFKPPTASIFVALIVLRRLRIWIH